MKRLTYILLPIFLLTACGGPSVEEQLAAAEDRKEELQGLLQTEEVNVQKNTLRLDALEEDISKMQSVIGNSDIDEYVSIVGEYSNTLEKELEKLDSLVKKAKSEQDLSIISKDIDEISSKITEAISSYENAVENVELNEYLKRQHSSLQLANDEIESALHTVKNGAEASSMEAVNNGIEQFNSASEYY